MKSFETAAAITKGYLVYLSADDKVSPSPGEDDATGHHTREKQQPKNISHEPYTCLDV